MKTYCLSIQKGGTGKTSLSMALAGELADYGPTVIIDADPQGNTSGQLFPTFEIELADLLFDIAGGNKPDIKNAIKKTAYKNLYIIPTAGLDGRLRLYAETLAAGKPWAMDELIRLLATEFDYCIIDTSPAFSPLEKSSLIAADECITPLMGDTYGSDGLTIFLENLETLKRDQRSTRPAYNKILFNAYDKRITSHEKILKELREGAGDSMEIYCFPTDPIYRRAQDKRTVIQELTGAKQETRSEISRLASDLK